MKAAMVATVLTDRSMPPVSIVMVWEPASRARGMENLIVLASQRSLTMPGRRICNTATRAISRMISGTSGWSLMKRLMRRPSETGWVVEVTLLMACAPAWRGRRRA